MKSITTFKKNEPTQWHSWPRARLLLLIASLTLLTLLSCSPQSRPTSPPTQAQAASATPLGPAEDAATADPTDIPTEPSQTPTRPTSSATPVATVIATATTAPAVGVSPTLTPADASPVSNRPVTSQAPVIHSFTVEPAEVAPGESVLLTWSSSGASSAVIGGKLPAEFLAEGREVPTSGTIEITIPPHERHWHEFELVVTNPAGQTARRSFTVEIQCPYTYFFSPIPDGSASCPYKPAAFPEAAEQVFEHGRVMWFKEIPAASSRSGEKEGPHIYVLYDDGHAERFEDTWTEDEADRDPNLAPPQGLYQPVRGFGKVWRNEPGVRERLGWALAPERAFEGAFQLGWMPRYLAGPAYLGTTEKRVIVLGLYNNWGFFENASSQPAAPATATPAPTSSGPSSGLSIDAFTVNVQDLPNGKRLTFDWETTGAAKTRIVSGTARRFMPWWDVPPDGTLTVDLAATLYRNPAMTLVAYNEDENQTTEQTTQSIVVEWPCEHAYFFSPPPEVCAVDEATLSPAAEQSFEGGRMIWLKEMNNGEEVIENVIFVLYDDQRWEAFEDTWRSGQPESDPALVPPAGLYQPVRGFGKLWRENEQVRKTLGWATAPEQGFEGASQRPLVESIPSVLYVRTFDDRIAKLYGWQRGNWEFFTPQ